MNPSLNYDRSAQQLSGPAGTLPIAASDLQAIRFLMLLEGQCLQGNIAAVTARYGLSRQRYYQLLDLFTAGGLAALTPQKTGPKSNYRRTDQVVRQVLRYRFLDPDSSPEVIAQKLRQREFPISDRSVSRIIADYGIQKKLHTLNPKKPPPPVPVKRAGARVRLESADDQSLERGVRQILADKVSGGMLGLWLLVPEHLRLGTWDLLRVWSGESAEPSYRARLALHLVHEAALCRPTLRAERTLRHNGFELLNGLPWIPTDGALHDLLDAHTILQAQQLQIQLGKLRYASGHFPSSVLALDPHRLMSYSKRDMMPRRPSASEAAIKQLQTFFLLDTQTRQPLCLVNASSARHLASATQELLQLAEQILPHTPHGQSRRLIVADAEHFRVALLDFIRAQGRFDLLVPLYQTRALIDHCRALPAEAFVHHWPGFAIATEPVSFRRTDSDEPCYQYIQRTGERPEDYHFKPFGSNSLLPEVPALTRDFPSRWHIEEFYRFDQDLGWKRAGTLNLHVRLGQMTMALVAQALIYQLRSRLGAPFNQWDSPHLAKDLFGGLEGDVRVHQDTIVVTYYNAPEAEGWKKHFENLPSRLEQERVDPHVPWLYNYKVDFRFK